MGVFDYYTDKDVNTRVRKRMRELRRCDRSAFRHEVMMELYDFMPFDCYEIRAIIDRVFNKFYNGRYGRT